MHYVLSSTDEKELDPKIRNFYKRSMFILNEADIPFLVGGAYALKQYTGIIRHTKDFDLFALPEDVDRILDAFGAAGYSTERTSPHWIAKAFGGEGFIDIIFGLGKSFEKVDAAWFTHAIATEIMGIPAKLIPPEEMIWSKAFVMERERYDGSDIFHVIRSCGDELDWPRIFHRFGLYLEVLLSYVVLYDFVYPSDRAQIPDSVRSVLLRYYEEKLQSPPPEEKICRGPLISNVQYKADIELWGYKVPEGFPIR